MTRTDTVFLLFVNGPRAGVTFRYLLGEEIPLTLKCDSEIPVGGYYGFYRSNGKDRFYWERNLPLQVKEC